MEAFICVKVEFVGSGRNEEGRQPSGRGGNRGAGLRMSGGIILDELKKSRG